MSKELVKIGISTCPNDTFAFHALMEKKIQIPGVELQFELHDVEELNSALMAGHFDLAKASYHCAIFLADQITALRSGSALGFGVGPLLLASRPLELYTASEGDNVSYRLKEINASAGGKQSSFVVGCPGKWTTATLLFKIFFPDSNFELKQQVFSSIMPQLEEKRLDLGICIHEGRFTYMESGLEKIADLGDLWHKSTPHPLPLGGIFARNELAAEHRKLISKAIHESILYSRTHPEEAMISMRRYAQEFEDQLLSQHVDLYVNEWTLDIQEAGIAAVNELCQRAKKAGILPESHPRLCFQNLD